MNRAEAFCSVVMDLILHHKKPSSQVEAPRRGTPPLLHQPLPVQQHRQVAGGHEHLQHELSEYLLTPPIFDLDAFDEVLPRLQATGLPIIAGVLALESVRQAEFHASEVSGVRLPESVLERLRAAADPAAAGHEFSTGLAAALRGRVQGLRLSTLHGRPESGQRLLAALTGQSPIQGIVPAR
jgi:hypothetical protein